MNMLDYLIGMKADITVPSHLLTYDPIDERDKSEDLGQDGLTMAERLAAQAEASSSGLLTPYFTTTAVLR
jgi:hypothetical protein